jgi:hypothetical protein
MITFNHTADPHSMEIGRDGLHVGFVQWHPGRSPRVVLDSSFSELDANEMWDCLRILNDKGKFQPPQDRPMKCYPKGLGIKDQKPVLYVPGKETE